MAATSSNVVKKLLGIANRMGRDHVNVGFLEGATYEDGTPVAAVMFWNEFGHNGQFPSPPRPAFRQMVAKEKPTWAVKVSKLAKANNFDGKQILGLMGADIAGALRQSIADLTAPPLSQTTLILRKKFGNNRSAITQQDVRDAQRAAAAGAPGATGTQAKPLIWTGHAINSIDFEVKQ